MIGSEMGYVVGVPLLIAGIFLILSKKENKLKLLSGIICSVLGWLFILLAIIIPLTY